MSGGLADLSEAVQDYLREIYKLQLDTGRVRTSTLATRMGVAAPSATAMVKKLDSLGLADHQPYRGVRLTRAGERLALEVLRRHRLLELYLAETLEVDPERIGHLHADEVEILGRRHVRGHPGPTIADGAALLNCSGDAPDGPVVLGNQLGMLRLG